MSLYRCFKRPKTIDFRKILFSTGQWLLNDMVCGFESRIGHSFYTSLNNNYMEGEMYFNSRLDVNFLDSTQNIDKVSGA